MFKRSSVREVTPADVDGFRDAGATLVDVRTHEEWNAGHLPDARHFPMDEIGARLSEFSPEEVIVFVCRSGHRSGVVAEAFAPQGFDVANLVGGMKACQSAGLPVVRDDGSAGTVL